jgi:hypothetical protein
VYNNIYLFYAFCVNVVVHQENEKRIKKNNEKLKNSLLEGILK